LRRVDRIKSIGLHASVRRESRRATTNLRKLAGRLRALATEILRDVPEDPDRSADGGNHNLLSDVDTSSRKGYQGPASALMQDDMRMLDELRRDRGIPIAALVHQAISVLYALPRADTAKLEQLREMTGRSIRDLLTEAVSSVWERYAGTAQDREHHGPAKEQEPADLGGVCRSSEPIPHKRPNG
jgi:hypothetical protein